MTEMGDVMTKTQIDQDRYRLGVGMVIVNQDNRVFWASRSDCPAAWQFPQGGIHCGEAPCAALYRELQEEVGLSCDQVALLAESQQWYTYLLPQQNRIVEGDVVIGQKQRWFLLRLLVEDAAIRLDSTEPVEFGGWRWVDYWTPLAEIVSFKRDVYQKVLTEFSGYLGK